MKEAIYQLPLHGDFDIRRELLFFDKIYIPVTLIKQKTSAYENTGYSDLIEPMYEDLEYLVKVGQVEIIDIKELIIKQKTLLLDKSELFKIIEDLSELEIANILKRLKYFETKTEYIDRFLSMRPGLRNDIDSTLNPKSKAEKMLLYSALREKYDGSAIEYGAGLLDLADIKKEVIPIRSSFHKPFLDKNSDDLKVFSTLNPEDLIKLNFEHRTQHVARVVLKKIPIPNYSVPLEQILEFKSNSENKRKLRDLNHWVKKIGSENISSTELEQEIDYLLNEYKRVFELNKMKYDYSKTQIVLNTTLGTLEKLVKIKWGELANSFFELKQAKVDSLLAESQMEGRELAYLLEIEKSIK